MCSFSNLATIKLCKNILIFTAHTKFLCSLTPLVASVTCLIVICFSELRALAFTGGVILLFAIYYLHGVAAWQETHTRALSPGRYRLLLPVTDFSGLDSLMKIGAGLAEAQSDMNMCMLLVMKKSTTENEQSLEHFRQTRQYVMEKFIHYAIERNVPTYSKTVTANSLAEGIIDEIKMDNNVRLLLLRMPRESAGRID